MARRFGVAASYEALDRAVARRISRGNSTRLIYAYEDGALAQFRMARDLGIKRVYELPIGYWRAGEAILGEEVQRKPEWAATLPAVQGDAARQERKERELELAEVVIVASSFTRSTLLLSPVSPKTVSVVPYGAPPVTHPRVSIDKRPKLRVLFVGALSQRKGISYLFEAVEKLGSRVELTVIGRQVANCETAARAVARHRWLPTLSHTRVLDEMRAHDVLVFPSLFEGFGLVILEAMAQGLPVVTTPNTAGADVIEDGVDGFVVPIRSADAIVDRLGRLCDDGRLLTDMALAAQRKAQERNWSEYGNRLIETIRPLLERQ